ncbi:MAG: 1-acyl-sn-glycerol-3-phosphate acyltransferase [Cytophagia bacterium]|nr:1-acyl-sn-glycerol-3-phosphate acyltransferase [Cytophagia bacterium]
MPSPTLKKPTSLALALSWVLGWIGTPLYLLGFGMTVLVFDPILRLSYLLGGYQIHQNGIRLMNRCLYQCLLFNGCRISWNTNQNLPDPASNSNTKIFVANHQSLNDIPPLIWKLRTYRPVLVSKAELANGIPSVSYNFKTGGVIAIQRKNPNQSLVAMHRLGLRIASSGESVLYFPEGTRSRNGRLGTFKSGGLEQLMKSVPNIELVPVAVQRSWELARWNFLPLPFGITLRFDVLPSINAWNFDGDTIQKARAMMQAAQNAVQQHIHKPHAA